MTWIVAAPPMDEVALDERARELLSGRTPGRLAAEELRRASAVHGIDLATAMADAAVRMEPGNAGFLARLQAIPVHAGGAPGRGQSLLVVPTMYYRERPELGGDGGLVAAIAARLGAATTTAPVASLGSIERNAEAIAGILAGDGRRRWIVSVSKGSADVKRALTCYPDVRQFVAGWISLAGMPGGTPLASSSGGLPIPYSVLAGWLAMRGAQRGMLAEMSDRHPFSLAPHPLPADIPTVSVIPMPLSWDLRRPVDRTWRWLGRIGPNDGYVLLENALLPGYVIPLRGADHYLRSPNLSPLLYRLLRWAFEHQP